MTESHNEPEQRQEEPPARRENGEGEDVMYPASHPDSLPKVKPGPGGYVGDRDPAEDMPRMPTDGEPQDDES
jgi:hypothetical protein